MTRSLFRKLAGFIAGMLALSFAAAVPAGATSLEEGRSLLTIQTYAAYLAKEAPDVLPKFEALSASDKERYLELLANPILYTDRAENLDGVTVGGNTAGLGTEPTTVATRSTDRTVASNRWVDILGLKVLEYRMELRYQVKKGKVSKINGSKAIVVRNLNPLVKTGQSSKSAWVSSGGASARMNATFNYDIGPLKGLAVQILTLNGDLTGYPNGEVSYNWWGS
ncbi:hypothetical protein [Mobiluncus mulieris]|uniref:Uncharacterized protein n=1 Tax=Mobiluncus mulieris TaxID=2052 RepID=A0ABD4TSW0_9ACTO|nr:hypothetical protein [Mobiluncus mulieris]MCU9967977.1 hypothetical protein [Mobiluncus mulieris]NMW74702.1 hypothetical protein [Mobiluncus mulieris]NMX00878.1 hypothetical protein [Mobiluncus mulieris]NMX18708.1 hypothetical protein [Mobiluncus mulieris]